MSHLTDLPNIGRVLARSLNQAGIDTPEALRQLGAKQAFLCLRAQDPTACLSMLQALEGAVRGVRWHALPQEVKDDLHAFYRGL